VNIRSLLTIVLIGFTLSACQTGPFAKGGSTADPAEQELLGGTTGLAVGPNRFADMPKKTWNAPTPTNPPRSKSGVWCTRSKNLPSP
jgi:hypothetical protein